MVDEKDLANCRLVCSIWCAESLERWRRTQTAIVRDAESESNNHANFIDILEFMSFPANKWEKKPFTKFMLTNWLDIDVSLKSSYYQMWREFWEMCGPNIETLTLKRCVINSKVEFEDCIYSECLPNLKELYLIENICRRRTLMARAERLDRRNFNLNPANVQRTLKKLHIGIYEDGRRAYGPPVNWIQFFAHFPNVEIISFGTNIGTLNESQVWDYVREVLDSLAAVRNQNNRAMTRRLELDLVQIPKYAAARCIWNSINALRLLIYPFITSLTLDFGYELIYWNVLQHLPLALRKLTLFVGRHGISCPKFRFRNRMDAMKELRLVGPFSLSLSILKETPNLEIFQVCSDDTECYGDSPIIPIPHSLQQMRNKKRVGRGIVLVPSMVNYTNFSQLQNITLEKMKEFNLGMEFVPSLLVKRLTSLMPNLKR
ncbi:unnamed protein product [Orchesella dallaii]|uniref:F-box domain-containing protein n=1 Tax=Orchesella dallaii TaxID=48710 RepID=A0ABP1R5G3_9HEXA